MSDEAANGLHLPNLTVSNFRGIGSLSIERLGRVTLLGGRNGVGKTTVLEAVRTYASRGRVMATTHSKDCVTGFARAAIEFGEALGVYLRLERDGDQMRAVEYTEEELQTVADQGIEVR